MKFLTLLTFLIGFGASNAQACGTDSDCFVDERSYRIAFPPQSEQVSAAIVFAHGFGGSAQETMNNNQLAILADDLGVALVALQSASVDWELPFSPRAYDSDGSVEFAYVDAVLEDLRTRHNIDTNNMLMTGFSAGGMMTWNLACYRSTSFIGFAPLSGTFWLEEPNNCDADIASVYHFHGDNDTVVPFEGRQIRNTHQGSISQAITMYREHGKFMVSQGLEIGGADCEMFANQDKDELAFCTFEGGHTFRTDFIRATWERLHDGS